MIPALEKELLVVVGGKESRVFQQLQTFVRNAQRPAEEKCTDCIRDDDYRHERQERIVEEGTGVNRYLVETKDERHRGRHDRVETEKR